MKKVLYAILFLSLFSFLIAEVKVCDTNEVMACTDLTIECCKCVPRSARGSYAIVTQCSLPKKSICEGNGSNLKCYCSSS